MNATCTCHLRILRLRATRGSVVETLLDPVFSVPDALAEGLWQRVSEITSEIAERTRAHYAMCEPEPQRGVLARG